MSVFSIPSYNRGVTMRNSIRDNFNQNLFIYMVGCTISLTGKICFWSYLISLLSAELCPPKILMFKPQYQ